MEELGNGGQGDARGMKFATGYEYDASGKLRSQILPEGGRIRLRYGEKGRLEALELHSDASVKSQTIVDRIKSNALTGVTHYTHGSGLSYSKSWDRNSGLMKRISVELPHPGRTVTGTQWGEAAILNAPPSSFSNSLYRQALHYDSAGRIVHITRGGVAQSGRSQESFEYDMFSRLRRANTALENVRFTYDHAGNRVETSVDDQRMQKIDYLPRSNRISTHQAANRYDRYEYDASGNPKAIGNRQFTYDALGRIVQVIDEGKARVAYRYNAPGERIARTTFGSGGVASTSWFLYEDKLLDAEVDSHGRVTRRYIYLGNSPVALIEYDWNTSGGTDGQSFIERLSARVLGKLNSSITRIYSIHTDHLGAPRLMTDEAKRVVWAAEYQVYGKASVSVKEVELNLRLPGQYFEEHTGFHYNYHRDYDPETGRYLTADPIGLAGGMNGYVYGEQSPLHYVDPLGLAAYVVGTSDPQVPVDPGAGPWNTMPASASDHVARLGIVKTLTTTALPFPPRAKEHMLHYLGNTGDDLWINLELMIQSVPNANRLMYREINLARDFAESLGLHQRPDSCTSITSSATSVGYNRAEQDMDWFYAVGGYHSWGKADVIADPSGVYTMQFEYKFFDRYNWDKGKGINIAGLKINTDDFLADFHRKGLAREYNLLGSIRRTVTWKIGDRQPALE